MATSVPPTVRGVSGEGGVAVACSSAASVLVLHREAAAAADEAVVSEAGAGQIRPGVTPLAHGVQPGRGAVHAHVESCSLASLVV